LSFGLPHHEQRAVIVDTLVEEGIGAVLDGVDLEVLVEAGGLGRGAEES